ncbi:MAG: ATP-binding protein [Chromatiaceae bacterium]|jgi:two-component system C4-dicarboxylate transport sensor histidine kinase DctB
MASSNSTPDAVVDRRTGRRLGGAVLALILLGVSWYLGNLQRESLVEQLEAQGEQELALYVSHLAGQLDRFAVLPALLGDDFRLQSLLLAPHNHEQQDRVNRYLAHVNAIAGSLDVYLMDAQGMTVAASNWQDEFTFVGQNFAFRPYFVDAMNGRAGRYYALGTTSGRRGYYFSHPVGDLDEPAGVVAVKIDIDTLENSWRNKDTELIVSDPDGVIFVSTRPEWRYRTTRPLSAQAVERIRASRRYPSVDLKALDYQLEEVTPSGARLLSFQEASSGRYVSVSTEMPQAGWRVQLLVSQQVIAPQVWQTRLFALTLSLLLATAAWLFSARIRRRRDRQIERQEAMQAALDELERRVGQRTRDLTAANRRLRQEVEEHECTRDELIQAAKLAALGQMSAGINHELNQPLSAMRTYADNARTYLARENLEQAEWNLKQISELTRRMAQISGQLKVFSRKTSGQRIRVSMRACVEGARRILHTRLAEAGAELMVDLADGDLSVAADMVQLEQVLVNLIGNACDALEGQVLKRIEVRAAREGPSVRLQVRDSGPGIATSDLERVFDPFFTTTEGGLGLGLSISHTIVQRLGGSLTAGNVQGGGAEFTLTLAAWDDEHCSKLGSQQ